MNTQMPHTIIFQKVIFVLMCTYISSVQAFTLTVPYRGALPQMNTATTTIEFDASNIADGAQIGIDVTSDVSPPTQVNVPSSGCVAPSEPCSVLSSTSAGDVIQVDRINGTNRAILRLTYSSSFPGGNYCAYSGPAGDKTYDISLTGFAFTGATKGYRFTSFMAPSTAHCQTPYARVPGPKPSITVGASDPASLDNLGRLPLNLVYVLDRSGSMDTTITGTSETRWDRLKESVRFVTSVWEVMGNVNPLPPHATVRSEGHVDDKLGLVLFNDTASNSMLGGTTFFQERGASASPWLGNINTEFNSMFPTSGTSIGAGVQNAKTQLDTVDLVQGDSSVILFTDGEQNISPCIIREGEVLTGVYAPPSYDCNISSAQPDTAFLELNGTRLASDLLPRGPIYTVGFGEAAISPTSVQLLQEISSETSGISWAPLSGLALDYSILNSLIDTLKGSTVTQLSEEISSIPVGSSASTQKKVYIDSSLTRVTFTLTWEGGIQREVSLEIRRPDGTIVRAPLSKSGNGYHVAAVDVPTNGPAGEWKIRVLRGSLLNKPLNYRLAAYGVESRLSSRVTATSYPSTGDEIKVVAEVGWGSEGLANLPAGSIKSTIVKPGEDIGTILHESDISLKAHSASRTDFQDLSPTMYKIQKLVSTERLLERIKPKIPKTITLGNKGEGRYEGTFKGTNVGGTYSIRVDFNWTDERTGKIVRIEIAEKKVAVLPNPKTTLVEMLREGKNVFITLTPRDGFGNYVGPGFENQFDMLIAGKPTRYLAANPRVNGSYVYKLDDIRPTADPKIKITYGGKVLRDSKLSEITEPGPGDGNWFKSLCEFF